MLKLSPNVELRRQAIIDLLKTNDKAIARALVVLYNNQTSDEQETNSTNHHNGRGFAGFDAEIGTKMAKFYLERGYLTPGQIGVWRKINRRGSMRIANYWRQLIAAADAKAAAKAAQSIEETAFNFGHNVA